MRGIMNQFLSPLRKAAAASGLFLLLMTSCNSEEPRWQPSSADHVLVLNPGAPPEEQSTARITAEAGEAVYPTALQELVREDLYSSHSLEKWVLEIRTRFFEDMQDLFDELSKGDFGWADHPRELFQEYRISPAESLPGIFALQKFWSAYEGGAHPNHSEDYFLYRLQPLGRMDSGDILQKERQDEIAWLLNRALGDYFKEEDLGDVAELLLVDEIPFPEDVLPTPQGLKIQWDPYEITPYALGSPEVLIPWKDLKGVITPEFRSFLPSAALP